MKETTKNAILNCDTLEMYLTALKAYFDTDSCKPGKLIKGMILIEISKFLSKNNVQLINSCKQQAINTNNITEFIGVIQNTFDTNIQFTIGSKQSLVKETERLMTLTNLKEKTDDSEI